MKIFSQQQLPDIDAATIQEQDMKSIDLMERAAQYVSLYLSSLNYSHYVIFAGPGNNGGDALAVARLLAAKEGNTVTAYLFNIGKGLSSNCEANRNRLAECPNVNFTEITEKFEPPQLSENTVIIDGLFGTGLNKPLNGGFGALVQFFNASSAHIVSIDMPSGLMCENNAQNVRNHIVRANTTITFGAPKIAQLMADNHEFVGKLIVADIGLSDGKSKGLDSNYEFTDKEDIKNIIRKRDPFGHKGTFGHSLLIAGTYGMAGAAILATRACLRSGVGKVTVRTPFRNNDILQLAVPEAVLNLDSHEKHFSSPINTDDYTALAIGPGLGTNHDTAVAFIEQVRRTRIPLVIDADGLNILADHKGWIQQIPSDAILTPHFREMQRIGSHCNDSFSALTEAQEMAIKHSFFIILKGHFTTICTPEGKTFFNSTGNSGMATAGSGDILTGIICALLAQKYTQAEACRLGVYIHGLAGDIAASKLGETSLIASDIIEAIPEAFLQLSTRDTEDLPSPDFLILK